MKKMNGTESLTLSLLMVLLMSGCIPATTPDSVAPDQTDPSSLPADAHYTILQAEDLAGFDVKEPEYLPTGVSFEYATYQDSPSHTVTLRFKLVHETYGDMGAYFQIVQEPQAEASPNPTACGESGNDCEIIQIGDMAMKYRLTTPTESLTWDADGFSFHLLRTAGEPNKIYKDELLKVAGSMK